MLCVYVCVRAWGFSLLLHSTILSYQSEKSRWDIKSGWWGEGPKKRKESEWISEWVSERVSAREACVCLNRGKYHGLHWTEACTGLIPESTPAFPYTLGQNRQLVAYRGSEKYKKSERKMSGCREMIRCFNRYLVSRM